MNCPQVIAKGLPGTPHPNPLPKGEGVACGAREMLGLPHASNANPYPSICGQTLRITLSDFPLSRMRERAGVKAAFRSPVDGPKARFRDHGRYPRTPLPIMKFAL